MGSGQASHADVTVRLTQPPDIGIEHLRNLEYAPCVRVFEVRVSAGAVRDMTPAEKLRAQALLERMSAAARAALSP